MDTQDIAKFCLRSLQIPQTTNQTFFLSGSKVGFHQKLLIYVNN
jgi:hypothetical protein